MQDPADRQEKKFRDLDTLTVTQVEGALCAWEWMCENRDSELLKDYFEGLGSSGMRWASMQAGAIACQVHDYMDAQGYEFADAYDWEFVPTVLRLLDWRKLTDDNQYSGEPYKPDIHAIFCAMVAADKAGTTDPARRSFQRKDLTPEEFTARCCAEAQLQWGYAGLVADHMERVNQAMEAGEDPAEFIKWLGEKYRLTPVSDLKYG